MNGAIPSLAKDWFKKLGVVLVWYAVVFSIICFIIFAVSALFPTLFKSNDSFEFFTSWSSIALFMLILGIIMPLIYTKFYISLGISRKTLLRGMMIGLIMLAVIASFAQIILMAIGYFIASTPISFIELLSQMPLGFLFLVAFYLIGWIIALGFSYKRFITAAPIIILAIVLGSGLGMVAPQNWINSNGGVVGPLFAGLIAGATILILFAVVTKSIKKLPVSAS